MLKICIKGDAMISSSPLLYYKKEDLEKVIKSKIADDCQEVCVLHSLSDFSRSRMHLAGYKFYYVAVEIRTYNHRYTYFVLKEHVDLFEKMLKEL